MGCAVETPGQYEAVVYYTCPAADVGATIELSLNGSRIQGVVLEPMIHRYEEPSMIACRAKANPT